MANITFGTYAPEDLKEENLITTEIGVFFDGTKNNKNNTDARKGKIQGKDKERAQKAYRKYGGEITENESYNNDWSNVARLWENYSKTAAIYIEGIGTDDFKKDELNGYAFGSKETGIKQKVHNGCINIAKKINSIAGLNNGKKLIVNLDVFGFSRGAAAARHFVYEVSKRSKDSMFGLLGVELKNQGVKWEIITINVRFLGIFDTVSSYSEDVWTTNPKFDNDITELHLDEISKAKKIVHFTAKDEHRENFDLTDIITYNKSVKKYVYLGVERSFPGVHSDIGGGYENLQEKKDEIINGNKKILQERKNQLVSEGWFKDEQLTVHDKKGKLSSSRYVKKEYSFIPLHFMVDYADKSKLPFISSKLQVRYSINTKDNLLIRVKEKLRPYVMENGKPYSFKWFHEIHKQYKGAKIPEKRYADYQKELNEQKDLRQLRNEYLHWSADYDWVGMDPRENGQRVIH